MIKCAKMGPFIVASVLNGDCLFERETATIAWNVARVYDGTRPAVLKRTAKAATAPMRLFYPMDRQHFLRGCTGTHCIAMRL